MVTRNSFMLQENGGRVLQENNDEIIISDELISSPTVVGHTGTIGTRAINKDYPAVEGLIAGTTYQQDEPNLEEFKW